MQSELSRLLSAFSFLGDNVVVIIYVSINVVSSSSLL